MELLAGDPQPVDVPRDDGSSSRSSAARPARSRSSASTDSPEVRFVRGGTLDDPAGVVPDVHIYTRSKVPWVTLPESVPAFEEYYDTKELWPAASLERLKAVMTPASA